MTDEKIRRLFPDKPTLADDTGADQIPTIVAGLRELADQIERGEVVPDGAVLCVLRDHTTHVRYRVVGETTYHVAIAHLEIAKALLLRQLAG